MPIGSCAMGQTDGRIGLFRNTAPPYGGAYQKMAGAYLGAELVPLLPVLLRVVVEVPCVADVSNPRHDRRLQQQQGPNAGNSRVANSPSINQFIEQQRTKGHLQVALIIYNRYSAQSTGYTICTKSCIGKSSLEFA